MSSTECTPLYHDGSEPLPASLIKELAQRVKLLSSDARKARQRERWRILRSDHRDMIQDQVRVIYESRAIKDAIRPHIRVTCNPAEDVVRQVCAVYQGSPVRRVLGDEAQSSETKDAFHKLAREASLDSKASWWNQVAYFVGPVLTIPRIRGRNRKRLSIDYVEPFAWEAVLDSYDPKGPPVAACVEFDGAMADFAILDSFGIRYFNLDQYSDTPVSVPELDVETSLGRMPASVLRFESAESGDWYASKRHNRLIEGTVDVAAIYAALRFVRKSQNHKLLTVISPISEVLSKGTNTVEPELPIEIKTPASHSAGSVSIQALDFDTDPSRFLSEIKFVSSTIAESTGVRAQVVPGDEGVEFVFDHESLTEFRKSQIGYARAWEVDTWEVAVSVAKQERHPLADDLPAPDVVRDSFECEFPPLSRRFSDPSVENNWWEWRFKHGLSSVIDLARKDLPGSDSELQARIDENIAQNARLWDMLARRNVSLEPSGEQRSLPAQQGATGGRPVNTTATEFRRKFGCWIEA